MVALSLEDTRNTALLVVGGAVGIAIVLAWLMKTVVSKVLSIMVFGALAAIVWTQRTSLQECADRVGATLAAGAIDDTTCTFFGSQVTVDAPRD